MLVCVVAKIPCYCADGIVINMVVGGEVVTLKSIEESSNIVMQEMPMQVSLLAYSCYLSLPMSGSHGIHLILMVEVYSYIKVSFQSMKVCLIYY